MAAPAPADCDRASDTDVSGTARLSGGLTSIFGMLVNPVTISVYVNCPLPQFSNFLTRYVPKELVAEIGDMAGPEF